MAEAVQEGSAEVLEVSGEVFQAAEARQDVGRGQACLSPALTETLKG